MSHFSQTDFTEDLKAINVPVQVMHSEDDQIVPYVAAGPLSAKLLKHGTFKTYKDFPHGMLTDSCQETINADLLAFAKSWKPRGRLRNRSDQHRPRAKGAATPRVSVRISSDSLSSSTIRASTIAPTIADHAAIAARQLVARRSVPSPTPR